jgi:hypothetical protein
MSFHRLGLAFAVSLGGLIGSALADEPVLLRYKFAKGDTLIYRATHEERQHQTIADQKIETTTNSEAVTSQVVDEIDGDGNAILKTKTVSQKRKSDGQNKFEFDSKSTERDTSSEIGAAATPVLERLTGSEYQVKVTPRGYVSEIKGFFEIIADLAKEKPSAPILAGVIPDNEGQKVGEQEHFIIFSEKAVSPGDNWDYSYEVPLKGLGKVTGKSTYTYEGNDRVGDRKTVRIGVKSDLTIDFDMEILGVKLTGTMSSTNATGTAQFDAASGRIVSTKNTSTMTGPLKVEVGGMTFDLGNSQDDTRTVQLLDKIPE